MNPKEKAKELVERFIETSGLKARKSALICVEEIMNEINELEADRHCVKHWQQVKEAIIKL